MNTAAEAICAISALVNIISFLLFLSEFKSLLNDRKLDDVDGEWILYVMMNAQKDSLPKLMNYISAPVFILTGTWLLASPLRASKSRNGILLLFLSLLVCNLNFNSTYWTLRNLSEEFYKGKDIVPRVRRTYYCFAAFGYINALFAGFAASFQLHAWPGHVFTSRVAVVFLKTVLAFGVIFCAIPVQFMLGMKNVTAGIVLGAIGICLVVPVYAYTRFYLAKDTTEAAAHSDERVALIITSVPVVTASPTMPVVATAVPATPVVATPVTAYV